jgi:hypothetical protein
MNLMSSVAKKNAKSSLFSGKERKLGKLEGRGTLRFSITLLIGCTCTDFDFFFRVPDFIDCVRYRSKTTSIRLNLTHFLSMTPTYMSASIAETNGSLRSGNKSLLLDILLKNVDINGVIDFNDRSALIIDGQFLVQSLKHQGLRTFGEYADMYVGVVLRKCVRFRRIDVVFDRYRTQSIK